MKTSGQSLQDRREFAVGFCVLVLACARRPDIGTQGANATPSASSSAPSASAPSSRRTPGENPFRLPATSTSAKAGDFALVPSRGSLSQAFEQAVGSQSLLYAGAYIERAGERESAVVWLTQQRGSVPNSLVIALPRAERARGGDIVLKSAASGSGLERAIVVSEGESESPRVRGLDLPLDNASAAPEVEDTLPKSTFRVLREAGELGTTLACRRAEKIERFLLVASDGERRLGLGFAGRALLFQSSSCRALPLVPKLQAGARVFVPVAGEFVPAKVSRIDARSGRVLVEYEFAAESKEMAVGYTNVATELPP
jgi:hypothetical protein